MLTEAKKRANRKYNDKTYEQLKVLVHKGEREKIKAYAESQGKSLNGYINDLIKADMSRHTDGDA